MIETRTGVVTRISSRRPGLAEIEVETESGPRRAVAYERFTGQVEAGDRVLLNTTAVSLSLGSGGYDFVMADLDRPRREMTGSGHIMKMRYTPWQCRVLSVEEEDSPYRDIFARQESLEDTVVLVGTIHSMLAPLCACMAARGLKTAYVMTDAGSLSLPWSRTVFTLREKGLLCGTVTAGHAWGGDLEAVNVFSGLLAARAVFRPDVIIVAMGPGITGTGTKWGFSGVEQGVILNAVDSLGGRPVAVPRISWEDRRPRHRGISHHTLTALMDVCRVRVSVPLPVLPAEKDLALREQVQTSGLQERHDLVFRPGDEVEPALAEYGLKVTTMGRGLEEDREFFLALGAAASFGAELAGFS